MFNKLLAAFGLRSIIATGSVILFGFGIIVASVVGTGQTLGQRCKAAGIRPDSMQWSECLRRQARDGQSAMNTGTLAADARPGAGTLATGRESVHGQ